VTFVVCEKCEYYEGKAEKGKVYCLVLGKVIERVGCGIFKRKGGM
jgi:hypothetical protein